MVNPWTRLGQMVRQWRDARAFLTSGIRLRDYFQTIDLGVFMIRDLDGTIRFWSAGCAQLYGWTAAEAIGRSSHDLLQTRWPVPLAEIDATIVRDGAWYGDLQHRTRDGHWLIVRASKVMRRNGHVSPMLLEALVDVTEQRRAEQDLEALNSGLEARIVTEVAAREAAQERSKHAQHMQALGQVAAGVAHEFNNILQAVQGGLEVIETRPDDPVRVARFARTALSATSRGGIITRRLLGFAGRAAFIAEVLDPALVLDALHDVLAHALGGRITVRLDLEPLLPRIVADKNELETALINLATNARDAMPDGGTITLTARAETVAATERHPANLAPGLYVRIMMRDGGIGMDAVTMARAVEPFFTTKAVGAGTGLGLSMAKGFAEQSGGDLMIESSLGAGTTVTLWLPATAPDAAQTPPPPGIVLPPPPPPAGRRVLLVDDEPMVRETLAAGLEGVGFVPIMAAGGAEALALLAAGAPIDIVVTDYAMPGMDGLTLVRKVRAARPDLPVLLLTGYVEGIGKQGGEDLAGTLSMLRKPISSRQLASSIDALLTLTQNGAGTIVDRA
jgi:PAS domain S-box-containing protein